MIDKEQGLHSFGWVADISKVWLCLSLCDWHLGISFLTSLYQQLFKNIAYLGPFVQFWGGGRPSVYTEKNPKLSSSDRVEILPGVWLEPDWGLLMARHVKVEGWRPPACHQSESSHSWVSREPLLPHCNIRWPIINKLTQMLLIPQWFMKRIFELFRCVSISKN